MSVVERRDLEGRRRPHLRGQRLQRRILRRPPRDARLGPPRVRRQGLARRRGHQGPDRRPFGPADAGHPGHRHDRPAQDDEPASRRLRLRHGPELQRLGPPPRPRARAARTSGCASPSSSTTTARSTRRTCARPRPRTTTSSRARARRSGSRASPTTASATSRSRAFPGTPKLDTHPRPGRPLRRRAHRQLRRVQGHPQRPPAHHHLGPEDEPPQHPDRLRPARRAHGLDGRRPGHGRGSHHELRHGRLLHEFRPRHPRRPGRERAASRTRSPTSGAARPADPAWGTAYPLICWYMYQYYGDTRILEEHYDGLKKYVEFLRTKAENGLVKCSSLRRLGGRREVPRERSSRRSTIIMTSRSWPTPPRVIGKTAGRGPLRQAGRGDPDGLQQGVSTIRRPATTPTAPRRPTPWPSSWSIADREARAAPGAGSSTTSSTSTIPI